MRTDMEGKYHTPMFVRVIIIVFYDDDDDDDNDGDDDNGDSDIGELVC